MNIFGYEVSGYLLIGLIISLIILLIGILGKTGVINMEIGAYLPLLAVGGIFTFLSIAAAIKNIVDKDD
jgi:hypothetical protein